MVEETGLLPVKSCTSLDRDEMGDVVFSKETLFQNVLISDNS
jgi:hypothetical protein